MNLTTAVANYRKRRWQGMTMKTTGLDNERGLAKAMMRDDDSDKFSDGDEPDRVD